MFFVFAGKLKRHKLYAANGIYKKRQPCLSSNKMSIVFLSLFSKNGQKIEHIDFSIHSTFRFHNKTLFISYLYNAYTSHSCLHFCTGKIVIRDFTNLTISPLVPGAFSDIFLYIMPEQTSFR